MIRAATREQGAGVSIGPVAVCSVRGCGRRVENYGAVMCRDCTDMDKQLDEYFAKHQSSLRDRRVARFLTVFLVMLAGEGLCDVAFSVPLGWGRLGIYMAWAFLIAAFSAFAGGR